MQPFTHGIIGVTVIYKPAYVTIFSVSRQVTINNDPYTAVVDAHAIVVCTEWEEFLVSQVI